MGLFNWDDKPWEVDYPLDRLGLPEAKRFAAFDFWGNQFLPLVEGLLKATLPPTSCLVLALRPEADHPQVISTSRHVTQGMVDLVDEKWDGATKTLSGRSRVVAGDPYEIRVALGGKPWHAAGAKTAPGPAAATVTQDQGLARLLIKGAAGGEIEWSIQFTD